MAIVYACLVIAATRASSVVAGVCNSAFLRVCGRYSYVMYVTQFVFLGPSESVADALVPAAYPAARWAVFFASSVGLTLSAAWLSWRLLELPFHRLKNRFPYAAPAPKPALIARAS
jgi:peptidoglycan/LPS O-acetylase OafA/YrhL